MKAKLPVNIDELYGIEGVGPKTIKMLYDKLRVKNLADLERVAKEGKLRAVPGFTEKKEHDMLKRIEFFKRGKSRRIIGEIYPLIKQIEKSLSQLPGVKNAIAAGSVRRMKETIGDIDYLVAASDPEPAMEFCTKRPEVQEAAGEGPARGFGRLARGLQWITPEMRENSGEIELARQGRVPKLVEYGTLKGDLQVHSENSDGTATIEEMARGAKAFGLDYVAITDHTKSLALAGGLDGQELLQQANKIRELNDRLEGFRVLASAEVNIMKDGSLDIADNVLDKLDLVGAAIHSHFNLPIEAQTERLVRAAKNSSVRIRFHPPGR